MPDAFVNVNRKGLLVELKKSPMEILKHLEGTNCRECGERTCLAFAAAVFKGQKRMDQCPHVGEDVLAHFGHEPEPVDGPAVEYELRVEELRKKVVEMDLASIAGRLGGRFEDNKLKLKVLGKDFCIDQKGIITSEIHVHRWIVFPFLDYVTRAVGRDPTGRWVPFRELKGAKDWELFFTHRSEKSLKKIADTYTDLFRDMIHVFNGKKVENLFDADISLVLHPLPKTPMLINYWEPEDGLGSSLNLFFDEAVGENLDIGSVYSLSTGLVVMFEKVAQRHGALVK